MIDKYEYSDKIIINLIMTNLSREVEGFGPLILQQQTCMSSTVLRPTSNMT